VNKVNFEYRVGGSIPLDSPTYIKRQADEDLYAALSAGEFCYVLTSRQMGKSSLRGRVMQQLKQAGVKCSAIDLTRLGTQNVTASAWYLGVIRALEKDLILAETFALEKFWQQYQNLSPLQWLSQFIDTVLISHTKDPVVIFIDEIDSTISLNFDTDDFFAWIRSCFDQRMDNPQYNRLTFCLLGVATPTDLIQDGTRTPFNIGTSIELQRFQADQLEPLLMGLQGQVEDLRRARDAIYQWTGGQPFLTQRVCQLIQMSKEVIPMGQEVISIAELIKNQIVLAWKNKKEDNQSHLTTIRSRLLGKDEQAVRLLAIYQQILKEPLALSKVDLPELMALRLTGLVVSENGILSLYNRTYEQVFNATWVEHELEQLRPYADSLAQWLANNRDDSFLLAGQSLVEARQWATTRKLSEVDYQYLTASEKFDADNVRAEAGRIIAQSQQESEKAKANAAQIVRQTQLDSENAKAEAEQTISAAQKSATKLILIGGGILVFTVLGAIYTSYNLYQKFVYCPIEKGRPGERVGDVCFRNLKTSGDVGVFLSSTNFHLDKGVEAFRQGKYEKATKLFKQAMDGDLSDPIPKIFFNNAKARQQGNSLKLAVVASVDYYEIAAREVLRGVADAQAEFNERPEARGNQSPLMEIVIANDENEQAAAEKVAQELVDDRSILGIIGHHASESTVAAQPIYEKAKIAVVSPTSSSSSINLTGDQFFRTVGGTKKAAEKYADYIRKTLGLDETVIFYKSNSAYSENLMKDFTKSFSNREGKIREYIDVSLDTFEVGTKVKKVVDDYKIKAALVISNVRTNSIAIAINRKNADLPLNKKMQLVGAMSLSEEETLDKGGKAVEGMILVRPCFPTQSKYMEDAAKRWHQQEINWRTATSYDATQAFVKALNLSKMKTREDILRQLQSPSFSLSKEETSGFGLKWELSDHSNKYREYCVVQIKGGKFVDIDPGNTPVTQK
jgi:ABC-type branched-subunit amino acid transport system substrate-binding protein